MKRCHPEEQDVKDLFTQSSSTTLQKEKMSKIRKEGIYKENIRRIANEKGQPLLREREGGNDETLNMCTNCKGFYSKRRISYHTCDVSESGK